MAVTTAFRPDGTLIYEIARLRPREVVMRYRVTGTWSFEDGVLIEKLDSFFGLPAAKALSIVGVLTFGDKSNLPWDATHLRYAAIDNALLIHPLSNADYRFLLLTYNGNPRTELPRFQDATLHRGQRERQSR
jgi:hypothetical protein